MALSSLCHTANSCWLFILHMIMYIFPCYSLTSSHPFFPPLCPQVCSLCLCLHCCPANRFISTIFLDSMKVKVIQLCLTLCDLMDCPWNSLGQNTGVVSLSLLQGIFPTQGSIPSVLHSRQILYQLSHKGIPRITGVSSLSLLQRIF